MTKERRGFGLAALTNVFFITSCLWLALLTYGFITNKIFVSLTGIQSAQAMPAEDTDELTALASTGGR